MALCECLGRSSSDRQRSSGQAALLCFASGGRAFQAGPGPVAARNPPGLASLGWNYHRRPSLSEQRGIGLQTKKGESPGKNMKPSGALADFEWPSHLLWPCLTSLIAPASSRSAVTGRAATLNHYSNSTLHARQIHRTLHKEATNQPPLPAGSPSDNPCASSALLIRDALLSTRR